MLFGVCPFESQLNKDTKGRILKAEIVFPKSETTLLIDQNVSTEALDLIKRILKKDPSKRISIEEIAEHPFFTK